MKWFNILKISEDAKREMMGRFGGKPHQRTPYKEDDKYKRACDKCGKRAKMYNYGSKKLCAQCARETYGHNYRNMVNKMLRKYNFQFDEDEEYGDGYAYQRGSPSIARRCEACSEQMDEDALVDGRCLYCSQKGRRKKGRGGKQ